MVWNLLNLLTMCAQTLTSGCLVSSVDRASSGARPPALRCPGLGIVCSLSWPRRTSPLSWRRSRLPGTAVCSSCSLTPGRQDLRTTTGMEMAFALTCSGSASSLGGSGMLLLRCHPLLVGRFVLPRRCRAGSNTSSENGLDKLPLLPSPPGRT